MVVALVALFVAVGGSSYAAVMVTGKNIKNGSVTGKDVKNRTLGTKKLSKTAISSLRGQTGPPGLQGPGGPAGNTGPVGPAGPTDTAGLSRVRTISSAGFGEGSPLTLAVPGYGTFRLVCDDNGTPATANDDSVSFDVTNGLGATAIQSGLISSAAFPLATPVTRVIAGSATSGTFTTSDDRIFATYQVAVPGTEKAVSVLVGGHEEETSALCRGHIQAFLSG